MTVSHKPGYPVNIESLALDPITREDIVKAYQYLYRLAVPGAGEHDWIGFLQASVVADRTEKATDTMLSIRAEAPPMLKRHCNTCGAMCIGSHCCLCATAIKRAYLTRQLQEAAR